MIPDFQTLMKPVLQSCASGEQAIYDVISNLADQFKLNESERSELLPSGKQTRFTNRVHWARSYLKQAGLVQNTKRGHFKITETGIEALNSGEKIDRHFLEQYEEYQNFKNRTNKEEVTGTKIDSSDDNDTPDEVLRRAHKQIYSALASELLGKLKLAEPAFFEKIIVSLLLKMGYGSSLESGEILGGSGDDGVDGVINQDPLGVDRVYIQAKRYSEENKIGAGAIRDFYGALGLKDVSKGIFVTTSSFSTKAKETAEKLGARIVLIDGVDLAQHLIKHNIGCNVEETFTLSSVDENYFE